MSATLITSHRLYVGTYAKYNAGSIDGAWLDLEDYSSKEEFLEACAELHSDENDPEFMFQDFEGFPREFYSESSVSEVLFEFLDLDEDDRKIVSLYASAMGYDVTDSSFFDKAKEAYHGTADSEADFAENFAEDCGDISEGFPNWIVIDWEATWNASLRHDYVSVFDSESGDYYFFNRNI